jgi:hypothetical protein
MKLLGEGPFWYTLDAKPTFRVKVVNTEIVMASDWTYGAPWPSTWFSVTGQSMRP